MSRMMTSEEAAGRLGVKVTTLYVYVSRGLLQSHPAPGSRRSLFDVDDIERLARRSRGGKQIESRLAVVTTSITQLTEAGPLYRGRLATDLATTESFESVADSLWRHNSEDWDLTALEPPEELRPRDRLPWATVMLGARDRFRSDLRPEAVTRAARPLIASLVGALGTPSSDRCDLVLDDGSAVADSLAERLTRVLCPGLVTPATVRATNAMLVLLADHELATSTLAVRVAASTRGDLYDATLAGLGTIGGPLHSAASQLALDLLRSAERNGPEQALDEALRWHGLLPGFGHGAYPDGDPRATCLLSLFGSIADDSSTQLVDAVIALAAEQQLPAPNIDLALAAIAHTTGMDSGATPIVFTIARCAGWVAHYLEELDERPLRFRARAVYTTDG